MFQPVPGLDESSQRLLVLERTRIVAPAIGRCPLPDRRDLATTTTLN